jgi:glutathione S-transferase
MSMLSELPILYSFRRCPYAMRARMALSANGQQCELREIVLRDKAPEFLTASPKGTVPVIVLADGTVIEESFEIMQWALSQNDPERWLDPETGSKDEMLAMIAKSDGAFKRDLDAYKYAQRGAPEKELEARASGSTFLMELEQRLQSQPYLFGARVSLADMAIFPFVRQFANVDRAWFDGEPWRCLVRWLNEILESPRFVGVMTKYAKWHAGQTPIIFGLSLEN